MGCGVVEQIKLIFSNIRILDIVDIGIVTYVFYKVFMLIRGTRAKQLVKGIAFLLIITRIADWLNLYTINWILTNTLQVGFIALVIVFQPELRRALEYLGRTSMFSFANLEKSATNSDKVIKEIISACASLSRQKIGALIVFEQKTGLNDMVDTGTTIEGYISSGLLINIFIPNTPLHDGAVIIEDYKIKAAGCFLPLTENNFLSKDIGTRHRAALGITERSDSVTIIVSEETGYISYAVEGRLYRNIEIEELEKLLKEIYKAEEKTNVFEKWRHRNES